MDFDDLEKAWRSPLNAPSGAELDAHKATLGRRLRDRHRAFLVTIGVGVTVLLICAARFARFLVSGGAFDPQREWGGILLLLLPLAAIFVLFRQYRRHRAQHARHDRSIGATLRAALDENRLARQRIKLIAWLYGGMVVIFPVIVVQLLAVGKARPREVTSMALLFAGLVAVVAVCLAYHHRRRLLPQQRQLEALLTAYEADRAT